MSPEFGAYSLVLALSLALAQCIGGFLVNEKASVSRITWLKSLTVGQAILIIAAFIVLAYAFVSNDFSVLYVANHSNRELPIFYRVCAVWGGHEGSFLLWVMILSLWGLAIAHAKTQWPSRLQARILAVLGLLSFLFLSYILLASNPFERLLPFPPYDGRDLNPLLQDFGLAIHPPILYTGYVGLSVVFSFAIAVLLEKKFEPVWARYIRSWVNVAWIFLTLGIALGSWWAYYELGWGGWWFWDPVENASLMPWLITTALIHSLSVTDKRGLFKSWTLLLAIFSFSLSLLGTFLVRSGVLTSVHAFANDPTRGLFILSLIGFIVSGSLSLFAVYGGRLSQKGEFSLFSRESFLLLNNLLLVVITSSILLGTLYPLILDALNLGLISVGAPYFNQVVFPMAFLVIFGMCFGPILQWKSSEMKRLVNQIQWPILIAIVGLLFAIRFMAGQDFVFYVAVFLSLLLMLSIIKDIVKRVRASHSPWYRISKGFWGMQLAHFGVAITLVGIAMSTAFSVEKDLRMRVGDSVVVGGYFFTLNNVVQEKGPNFESYIGRISIVKNDKPIGTLLPEKRIFHSQNMPMTETAIHANLWRDLYVALSEKINETDWAVRIYYKPFVRWIWLGAIFMALGGFVAALDRRYRGIADTKNSEHELIDHGEIIDGH